VVTWYKRLQIEIGETFKDAEAAIDGLAKMASSYLADGWKVMEQAKYVPGENVIFVVLRRDFDGPTSPSDCR